MVDTHYGDDGTSAITWYKGQPTRERVDGVWSFVWRGWCAQDSIDDLVPDDGMQMPGEPDWLLTKVEVSDTDAPGIVDITLTYNYLGSQLEPIDLDEIEQHTEVISLEVGRARVHDTYVEGSGDASYLARANGAVKADEEMVVVGGIRYEYGYHEEDFEWTEDNIVRALGILPGAILAPRGLVAPGPGLPIVTDGKWMYRGKRIERKSDTVVKIGEQWEYNPMGWGV